MSETLWRVEGRKFVAGFLTAGGIVTQVAPILRRYVRRGMSERQAIEAVKDRGWAVSRNGPAGFS